MIKTVTREFYILDIFRFWNLENEDIHKTFFSNLKRNVSKFGNFLDKDSCFLQVLFRELSIYRLISNFNIFHFLKK